MNTDQALGNADVDSITAPPVVQDEKPYMPATYEEALVYWTNGYLNQVVADLKAGQPLPSPFAIGYSLMEVMNEWIKKENGGRAKGDVRIPMLHKMVPEQIARTLVALHGVIRVGPGGGVKADPDTDLLAIYVNSGPDVGTYDSRVASIRLQARAYHPTMTQATWKEVEGLIRDYAPVFESCADRELVAVNNGIFNYRTKELHPFTPSLVFLTKAPHNYVPNAVSPHIEMPDGVMWDFDSWLADLADNDEEVEKSLWEVISAIARPHVRWGKMICLYNTTGNNGKGTFAQLLRELVNEQNASQLSIREFGITFLSALLIGKSAVICDENDEGSFVDSAQTLKAAITQDVLTVNRKFKEVVNYRFHGLIVQCLNDLPRVKDKSDSLYRRTLFLPFNKRFEGAERKYIKDDYLKRRDVLEYVQSKALESNFYELSIPEAGLELLEQMKESNNPILDFWRQREDVYQWDVLPFTFLYDDYRVWMEENNPGGKLTGANSFKMQITAIANKGTVFECHDRSREHRVGDRMRKFEPLLKRGRDHGALSAWYDLWLTARPGYEHESRMPLKARGLLRREDATVRPNDRLEEYANSVVNTANLMERIPAPF